IATITIITTLDAPLRVPASQQPPPSTPPPSGPASTPPAHGSAIAPSAFGAPAVGAASVSAAPDGVRCSDMPSGGVAPPDVAGVTRVLMQPHSMQSIWRPLVSIKHACPSAGSSFVSTPLPGIPSLLFAVAADST